MTLEKKLYNGTGLFAVQSGIDGTFHQNGYSDEINHVGAISAKFSDGTPLKADSSKQLVVLQCKIVSGDVIAPERYFSNSWGYLTFPVSVSNGMTPEGAIGFDFKTNNEKIMHIDIDSNAQSGTYTSSRIRYNNPMSCVLDVSDDPEFADDTTELAVAETSGVEEHRASNGRKTTISYYPKTIQHTTKKRYARVRGTITNNSYQGSNILDASAQNINLGGDATIQLLATDAINGTTGNTLYEKTITTNQTITLDTDLLLVDSAQYLTLQIVSYSNSTFPVFLQEITAVHG